MVFYIVSRRDADLDTHVVHFADLSSQLVAPLTAEQPQVVLEFLESVVFPMILHPHALQKSRFPQWRDLVRAAEIDVHRR